MKDARMEGSRSMVSLEKILGSSPSEFLEKTCSIFMRVIESSSHDGEFLIYLFGLKLGERIGKEVVEGDHWGALSEVLESMGLAEGVDITEGVDGMILRIKFGEGDEKRRVSCGFVRGMVAGFISQVSGKYVLATDMGCRDGTYLLKLVDLTEGLDLDPPRNSIMEYLRVNPGAHMRQMARDLGMSLGSLRWHLNVLEKRGLVRERRKGNMTEFYPSEIVLKHYQISLSQGTS